MKRLLLLAGEESGVLYAEQIRRAALRKWPDVEVRGYGDYGFAVGDLAVMGILAVIRRIFFFMRVIRTMKRTIDEWRPDVVCTVDYPGMNLKLAAYAKSRGIRAVHVVCPQVWAWKQGRIPKIEASLDRLCCFFPFEPALFRPGFAEFVGHPLAEDGRVERVGSVEDGRVERVEHVELKGEEKDGGKLLAVLPGSRMGEIRHHMKTLLESVAELRRDIPGLRVSIPAANERAMKAIEGEFRRFGGASGVEVRLGGARELLRRADAAVVASGTATLEAALAGCPTVLVYKVDPLLAFIARRVITGVRHVGLANVMAEKAGLPCPMPELLQEDFTAGAVTAHLKTWLTDSAANAAARRDLAATTALLGTGDDSIERIVRNLV